MRPAVAAAAAGSAAALAAWAGWAEPRRLVTVRETLHLPQWPRELDGLRAGVLTDVHAGVPHVGAAAIARAAARLAGEDPDVVLLGGDFLDGSPVFGGRLAPERVAEALAGLRAPHGVFAVLGNHDWKRDGDRMWRALTASGVRVLENAAADAGGFHVAGVADLRMRRPRLPRTLGALPPDAPVLLLAHDPDVFPYVPARVALTVSGHLHGGQVAIPGLRRAMVPSRYGERYLRGHVVEDGRHLYVSSGLGTSGLPVRLLAPPEVVLLTLRAARPPA